MAHTRVLESALDLAAVQFAATAHVYFLEDRFHFLDLHIHGHALLAYLLRTAADCQIK
jgi:hypothetical protein